MMHDNPSPFPDRILTRVEWCAGLALTTVVLFFLLRFYLCSGPLWRDEAATVNLATLPTWHEVWNQMEHEAFFAVWNGLLRVWVFSGLGATDRGLRVLGLMIPTGVIGALWLNSWRNARSIPLLALALLGLNSTFLVFGSSIRGYGLGMLTGLLVICSVWQFVRSCTWRDAGIALLTCLLGVHVLFYNSVSVFAACCAGALVLLMRKDGRRAAALLGIGALAAVSMAIYLPAIARSQEWEELLRSNVKLPWLWVQFAAAFGNPVMPWLWLLLAALGVFFAFGTRKQIAAQTEETDNLLLYSGTVLLLGIPAYTLILRPIRYYARPWYFLVLMALVAITVDIISSRLAGNTKLRLLRVGACVLLAVLMFPAAWEASGHRRSNLDIVAGALELNAGEKDLILVSPWYFGISFGRYYHGKTQVLTLPPMPSTLFHRYDFVKQRILDRSTAQEMIDPIERTLLNGGTLWIVGHLQRVTPGQPPPQVPLPQQAPWGWHDYLYYTLWQMHAGYYLETHATEGTQVPVPVERPVSDLENVPLWCMRGYH